MLDMFAVNADLNYFCLKIVPDPKQFSNNPAAQFYI